MRIAAFLLSLALAAPAAAQTTGTISGTVQDEKGAAIAGATVTARSVNTNVARTAQTDADGRYRFETIVPGVYPGRTRHYHVKVQAPNGPILTTQLYFPGDPGNARDGIYRDECLMDVQGENAGFRFVVRA